MPRVVLGLALLLFASPAFAQREATSQPARIRFIDMEDFHLTGQRAVPLAFAHTARGRAQFESLVRLKKDVLPLLALTASSPALR